MNWQFDTDKKRTARRMTLMMAAINKNNFRGRQIVTCWTCHRGRDIPVTMPPIDTVYGEAVVLPDEVVTESFPGEPSVDQILDKYLQALGGTARLAAVTSFAATGTSQGFRGFGGGGQVQIYAKAPDQRATIIKFAENIGRQDAIRLFDGRNGWVSAPLSVVPQYALAGSELDGARIDALLSFPAQIKTALTQLRVGPPDYIDGREVQVVQGNGSRGSMATLSFDKESGLLVRMVRFRLVADWPGAHTSGLLRLSRRARRRHQDAVPLDVRMAQRSRHVRVERDSGERADRRGGVSKLTN